MKTYEGILIHPQLSGGRGSGIITVDSHSLHFKSDEISYSISFTELNITAGGAGNRYVFFKNETENEISIYTADRSVLKEAYLSDNPKFKNAIQQSSHKTNQWIYTLLIVIAVVISFIGVLYLSKDALVERLANQVPQEWENKAGDQLFNTLSLQYKFVKNDSLKKEFLKVAAPLLRQVEKDGRKIDLYFVNDPTINAFALPGGKVIVQTGLIENATSWEEVMGVLGHELAHITRRHHIRGVINNIGIYALLAASLGDISAIAGTVINLGGQMATLSNSRSFENEADQTGWDFLVQAKINPKGLISFFEILKQNNETELKSKIEDKIDLSFLSTHPDTQERIDVLKQKLQKSKLSFEPLPNTFENFKQKMIAVKSK